MRRFLIFLSLLLVAAGAGAWFFRKPLIAFCEVVKDRMHDQAPRRALPDPKRYEAFSSQLEQWRSELASRHKAAKTAEQKAAVEAEARILLEHMLPALMRCWIGTPWDFNGTAAKPGAGKIACGYFVSTVLQDAGFRVNRYQLAQQASVHIMHSFIPADSCTLSIGKSYGDFLKEVQTQPPGIYLVGLDRHVGFLVKTDSDFRFIHSSGMRPWQVVDESRDQASSLQHSKWRMLGNLTAHPDFVRTWLDGRQIRVVRN